MKYYLAENEQPLGPFEVNELIARGVKGTDLVWTEGFQEWVPAESVEEIRVALYATPTTPGEVYRESAIPQMPAMPAQSQCPPPPVRPAYQQPQPQQPAPMEIMPKTWLVESILVTILCCLPFGIVGIIKASKVSSEWALGHYEEARRASADAKRWTIIGFVTGLVVSVLYLIFMVTVGMSEVMANM